MPVINFFPPYPNPVPVTFTSSGTYLIPAWVEYLDIVALGGGGGGAAGSSTGTSGGGYSGFWNGVTVTRAQLAGATSAAVVTGGTGFGQSSPGGNGGNGGDSSVTIAGLSPIVGLGGGGGAANTGNPTGPRPTPGNFVYNGVTYFGGGAASGFAGAGGFPGASGAGGNQYPFSFYNGGTGAGGEVWIVARSR